MSTTAPHFTELPTEILEHVLLYMHGQDIIKMEAVNRCLRRLIHASLTLQHQRKLFAAGLIESHHGLCNLTESRRQYEEYVHKWSRTATVVKDTYKLPPTQFPSWHYATPIGRNMLVSSTLGGHNLVFLHIPPVTSRKPINKWNVSLLPLKLFAFAVYHPESLLAVAEYDGRSLRIHLLNIRDGSPYCAYPSNTITWDMPQGAPLLMHGTLAITNSRIMACLPHADRSSGPAWTMLVWDRKTGDLVLGPFAMNWVGVGPSMAIFLDEFRIAITTRDPGTGAPGLIVYNTLLPRDHPTLSRSFGFPPRYRDNVVVHVDRDRCLGTPDRDRPLITDPTQAILVLRLSKRVSRAVLLVVRIQALIERMCSTRTDKHIHWGDWGRGAVMMESPFNYTSYIYIHGTHVVVVEMSDQDGPRDRPRVCTFDFGRHGCGELPLRDGEGGGTVRKALFSSGNEFVLEGAELRDAAPSRSRIESQGDGDFFQMGLGNGFGSDATLNVWELT